MKLLVLQGLPASGKSQYAKELVNSDTSYVRVCRDDLRRMRGIYWLLDQEDTISEWERNCVHDAFYASKNVVIDATNLNPKVITKWKSMASKWKAEFEIKFFDVPVIECIERDALRTEGKVGAKVIMDMFNRYLKDKVMFTPITQDKSLPHAIIVDLDGTLAIHNGRNAFDYDKCDTDLVDPAVQSIVQNYLTPGGTKTVIFMSGREDSCKDKTLAWLRDKAGIYTTNLFMRKTGDRRKDDLVKYELFNQHVKDKFYVDYVLDDRLSVCRMWHKLG